MKRIALLTILMVSVVLLVPTYAGKPVPEPQQVEVVNAPENSVPIQGSVEVTNTNENAVPVAVTNPSVSNAVINGINREYFIMSSPTIGQEHVLISLSGPGSFLSARFFAEGSDVRDTFVVLEIDGNAIVQETLIDISRLTGGVGSQSGVTADGNRGYVLFVGFQLPVTFESSLVLKATPVLGVTRIRASVMYGQ